MTTQRISRAERLKMQAEARDYFAADGRLNYNLAKEVARKAIACGLIQLPPPKLHGNAGPRVENSRHPRKIGKQ